MTANDSSPGRGFIAKVAAPDTSPGGVADFGFLTVHVAAATTMGTGASSTLMWVIQTWGHVNPPATVDDFLTGICIFVTSLLLRKVAG